MNKTLIGYRITAHVVSLTKSFYYKVMKPDGSYIGQVDLDNGETTEEHFMDTHEALEAILRDLKVEVEYVYKEEDYD